jgi:hypothetical protein
VVEKSSRNNKHENECGVLGHIYRRYKGEKWYRDKQWVELVACIIVGLIIRFVFIYC